MTVADVHNDRITVFVRQCLPDLKNFDRVPEWARHHAREYFHNVCRQPGFLPVYHALYRAGSNSKHVVATPAPVATRPTVVRQNALPSSTARPAPTALTRNAPTSAPRSAPTALSRENIFEASWPSRKNFTDTSAWARAHARNYYHQLNGTRTFLSLFKDLLEDAEQKEDETASYSSSDSEADDETLTYTSEEDEDEEEATFAQDGRSTRAEADEGRRQLNAICFREYRRWFSAFLQEEEEGDSDMTADERFALHAGRILHNKSGLPTEQCSTVVSGWLHMNKKHLV